MKLEVEWAHHHQPIYEKAYSAYRAILALIAENERLKVADDAYLADCVARDRKPTFAGMAYAMGFADRESITHYATYGEDYSRTVKRVKLFIEDDRQQLLLSKDKYTQGVALDLRNNHGWVGDKIAHVGGDPDAGDKPIQTAASVVIEVVGVKPDEE